MLVGPGAGIQHQRCPPGTASAPWSQPEQARRRREARCEQAALETGFNKCLGTSTALLRAEIFILWDLGKRSLKMAGAVCRVAR